MVFWYYGYTYDEWDWDREVIFNGGAGKDFNAYFGTLGSDWANLSTGGPSRTNITGPINVKFVTKTDKPRLVRTMLIFLFRF